MILCYANLLCVDASPIEMATSMTVEQARELLLRTQDSLDDARWKGASLLGTGFRQADDDPRDVGLYFNLHQQAGITLSVAPIAGLGYAHEAGTMGAEWREFSRRCADERAFVETVAAYCGEIHELPVVAQTDAIGEWRESFEMSLRRRIAYALGYHASLCAGSRDCYEVLYEPLIVGTAEQLDELTVGGGELERFSIALNLLSRLHRTKAYEKRQGAPRPDAPGKVRSMREKVALLEGRLEAAAKQLEGQLNEDGRIALRSLRRELRDDRERGVWNGETIWGSARKFLLMMLLAVSSACVTTRTLSADVDYSFRDENGVGWVTLEGNVAVTLTFTGNDGSLQVSGKRRVEDALLTDNATGEGPSPGLETSQWEGDVDETYPLLDVERSGKTITFELDVYDDHLTGSCAPTDIPELPRTSIYECKITGFGWRPAAELPELHHPIVLDADTEAKTRVVNSMTGATRTNFGQRIVRDE